MSRRFTRREALARGGLAIAGAGSLGAALASAPTSARPDPARWLDRARPQPARPASTGRRLDFILDMVQANPGEPPPQSAFTDPARLASYGYGGQVVNDWRPPSTAITYDSLHRDVFPPGSDARAWVQRTAADIDARIERIHGAGLRALYFTDLIVLPKRLVALYRQAILDRSGRIDLDRPMTQQLLRVMVAEIFARFPRLDGLVIRTGETYLQDAPFHTGNDPITRGAHSHLILLGLLRAEACVKRGKTIVYRTWSFDGFHTDPRYYLSVTDHVAPHPLLAFSIKHTKGDFFRTLPFNPTLAIGRHQQIVEVECQREYEGKGAHPNYVIDGVINGFEELRGAPGPIGLGDIRDSPLLRGVWTWSRGGGWRGPYISDELWCDLNAYVMSQWARDTSRSEESLFDDYMTRAGLQGDDRARFRALALQSATGVLHGHYTTLLRLRDLAWTRDQFLGGSDGPLGADLERLRQGGLVPRALAEKGQATATWGQIVALADAVAWPDPGERAYLRLSSRYGALLFTIIEHGWGVMLEGLVGDRTGRYDRAAIGAHLAAYDHAFKGFASLRQGNGACPTLYVPFAFEAPPPGGRGLPRANPHRGMKPSVDRYRRRAG